MVLDIKKAVEDFLKSNRIELSQEGLSSVVIDLKAWLKPSVEGHGPVKTQGEDYTLIHPHYGEPYHSLSAGAVRECLEKFLLPSGLLEKARGYKKVSILDIGFGLGYNVAVAIKKLKEINPFIEIDIISFEKKVPLYIPPMPEEYKDVHKKILDNLPCFEKEGINLRLYLGDARERIKEVKDFKAHAVFHDAFSPYKNPELWSIDFLREIKRLMDLKGVWVSYTSSLPVRKALKNLGFSIANTKNVGRKRGGTRAYLEGEDELSQRDLERINSSPYAIPFLDPSLDRKPLDILIDYRIRVELLKMAQGGLEPPTPRFSAGCSTN